MLHILWMLLKIIGIILLIVLGLLVLSVCVVLIVPLRYYGKAEAVGTLDSLKAHLKFSWFLHLVSGYVTYEETELKWQVRVFWKKLNVEKEPQETDSPEDESKTETVKEPEKKEESSRAQTMKDKSSQKKTAQEKSAKKQKKNIFEKIKYTFSDFCDKIKSLVKKKGNLEEFLRDEIHQASWVRLKQELWRVLKFLRPKKLILNLHFGFDDPSVTGKTLGVLCMLYPFYLDYVNLEPEFDKKILEGDAYIKGTIRGMYLIIVIWNLFFDKNIKTTYKAIKNWKR